MRALVVMIALSLTACDNINLEQYRIAGAAGGDTARIKRVLRSVADQVGLVDRTSTSRVPHTIVFYLQPNVQHFRVDLGARTFGEDVVVDLNAGFGPKPREYTRAKNLITAALSQEFGPRLSIIPEGASTVPINPE